MGGTGIQNEFANPDDLAKKNTNKSFCYNGTFRINFKKVTVIMTAAAVDVLISLAPNLHYNYLNLVNLH